MKTFFSALFGTLLLVTLYSCDNKKNVKDIKIETSPEDTRLALDNKNKQQTIFLSKQYNAVVGWDTINQYSYQLQEFFDSNKRPVSYTGIINDITKKDTSFILKLYSYNYYSFYTNFIAEIELSLTKLKELQMVLPESKQFWTEGCFIFEVTKVESMTPKLSSEIDFGQPSEENASLYDRDNSSASLKFDYDKTLIKLKGKLISFYIYEQPQESNK